MNRNRFNNTVSIFGLSILIALTACSEDKGNYDYSAKNTISISGIPVYKSFLANAEYIDFKPTVTSALEGTIEADNPNYEFGYFRKVDGKWLSMGTEKDLNMMVEFGAGTHDCYFSVTDKRTDVQTVQLFRINATTITSEGWMVLCNEGADEKLRMDMLSQISTERILPAYKVVKFDEGVPELRHATNIGYYTTQNTIGDEIMLLSKTAAYIAPTADSDNYANGEFTTVKPADELKTNKFLSSTDDHIIEYASIPIAPGQFSTGKKCASICVSEEGNAYAWFMLAANSGFEYPINTTKRGEVPEFKVAPHIGRSLINGEYATAFGLALLYDTDNHRFMGWDTEGLVDVDNNGKSQECYPLTDPESKKFSYNTGNMELVTMLNTTNNGYVYCIMQDGAKRHVYVIQIATPNKFTQIAAYEDILSTDFRNADCFAASSQYPVIYYAYKNKVYAYDLTTNKEKEVITLSPEEEVTLLKFNVYEDVFSSGAYINMGFLGKYDEATRQIYLDREKQLMVGSYNNAAEEVDNGGILRFYDVAIGGMGLNLRKDKGENDAERIWEFGGFARIKDVTYKEKG